MQTPILEIPNDQEKKEISPDNERLKALPYYIVLQKSENKTIKIPCSSELVAKKVLASYTNSNSNSKVPLV